MFVSMILDPIWPLYDAAVRDKNGAKAGRMAGKLGLDVPARELSSSDPRTVLQVGGSSIGSSSSSSSSSTVGRSVDRSVGRSVGRLVGSVVRVHQKPESEPTFFFSEVYVESGGEVYYIYVKT